MNKIKKQIPLLIRDRYRNYWHNLKRLRTLPIIQKAKWYFHRPNLPALEDRSINLHLGCGGIVHSSFINIDLVPYPHIHYLRPIDDLSIFEDESVDLIYASHCLEHFPFRRVPVVLAEWIRVLKKGGKIRISVPDFDSLVDAYQASGRSLDTILLAIVGGQDYEYNFHHVVFNYDSLADYLVKAGFHEIQEWVPGASDLTTFDDFSAKFFTIGGKSFPISLNIEAVK